MSNNERNSGGTTGSMDSSFAVEDVIMKAGDASQKRRHEGKTKKEEAEAQRKFDAGQRVFWLVTQARKDAKKQGETLNH